MLELARSVNYLCKQYDAQIADGEKLLQTSITSHQEYAEAIEQYLLWDDINANLIRATYKNDEPFKEYTQRAFAVGYSSFEEKCSDLYSDVQFGLRKLKSHRETLHLYSSSKSRQFWLAVLAIAVLIVVTTFLIFSRFTFLTEANSAFWVSISQIPSVVVIAFLLKLLKLK